MKELRGEVRKAVDHANDLEEKSLSMDRGLTQTRGLTGVRAASAYEDIVKSITDAKKFAEEASRAADNATTLVRFRLIRNSTRPVF